MKHIVNIAFDFEDEGIRKSLNDTIEQKVKEDIRQNVIDKIFEKQWYKSSHADPKQDPLKEWVCDMVKEMLQENKEDICRAAAEEIARSMMKSKKWKDMVAENVEIDKQRAMAYEASLH